MINKKLLILLQEVFILLTSTIIFFLTLDDFLTKLLKTRGFSQFFESNPTAGYINKRGFKGRFGGPLE